MTSFTPIHSQKLMAARFLDQEFTAENVNIYIHIENLIIGAL